MNRFSISNGSVIKPCLFPCFWSHSRNIPQYSEVGTWYVNAIHVEDNAGNGDSVWESEIIALGFPTKLEIVSEPTINAILLFFNACVKDGTLQGVGRGAWIAELRLKVMRWMLEKAAECVEEDDSSRAWFWLGLCYSRCAGEKRPPDSVEGPATEELSEMIVSLIESIGCE